MIEIHELTKRYGPTTAVSDLTFTVRPGTVTGFLGPNGAGKSTTMRMILGLDEPISGSVTVNGRPPRAHAAPLHEVGGMLDPRAVHPSRSARNHLLALAATSGIRRSRVDEVIDAVGLRAVAGRAAGTFSLGMAQRLGIAAALLGDPATVVLDEPVNGLDVEGIRWIRALLQELAGQGKTVFVSSHLMSEIAQTATRLIVIGKGRLIADTSVAEFIASAAPASVRVRSSDQQALAGRLRAPDVTVSFADDGALLISGLAAERIGAIAASAGIAVAELSTVETSLEDAFVDPDQGRGGVPRRQDRLRGGEMSTLQVTQARSDEVGMDQAAHPAGRAVVAAVRADPGRRVRHPVQPAAGGQAPARGGRRHVRPHLGQPGRGSSSRRSRPECLGCC